MKIIRLFFITLYFSFPIFSQVYTQKDVEICNSKFELAIDKKLSEKPISEIISEIGKSFLETPYEAFSLEKEGDEQLVIHLSGLDCTTFLENTLTLSRCIKKGNTTFEDYQKELTYIRYRDGKLKGYPSRLHYFSDWIFNNTSKGIVKDVTKEIGGEKIKFNVFFMSKNPDKYKHLNETPAFIPTIAKQEKAINKRQYYFIPNAKVEQLESKIQNGDLIAITTNIKGLDIGHVGIAVKESDGRIHFLHAPLAGSKVQISEKPLPEYLAAVKKHTGIIVLRAQ
ncbi:MAG: DUF1460 domain-containing protein [Ignavibacteriaceae bacterium]|nr:DUF1460 domain-containing protein [Ignavibacteriaceae bacterium]